MSGSGGVLAEIDWLKRISGPRQGGGERRRSGRAGRSPEKFRGGQVWRALSGSNAAVFKKIRNAGTHHPKQLAGQMAYLNGKSDLVFGNGINCGLGEAFLSDEAVEDMIEDWSEGWRGQPKNGHTTHLVLSFPGHVTPEQVALIAEEWCEDMFQAVDAGMDEWSYYAAVHLDQPHHPHVHVIVNNRGLRNGDWFYMAEGHDFSYQNMKQRMVEISENYGVYLDATSRLERGVIEYAPSDAEYRRAIRMGIEPKGRAREGEALDKAYALLKTYAEQCHVMADVAEGIELETMADLLRGAATDLENARPIYIPGGTKMDIDLTQHPADIRDALNNWAVENEAKIAALDPDARKDVVEQLHKTLDHIETVLDKDYQVNWTPPASEVPAFSQPFASAVIGDADRLYERAGEYIEYTLPEDFNRGRAISNAMHDERIRLEADGWSREEIADEAYEIEDRATADVDSGRMISFRSEKVLEHYIATGEKRGGYEAQFEAVEAAYTDLAEGALADGPEAMAEFRQQATDAGLDPDLLQSRMARGAVNAREEEEWLVNDIQAVLAHQGLDSANNDHVTQATTVVRTIQDSIAERMDDFYNRHRELHQVELRTTALQVAREVETYGEPAFASRDDEQKFIEQMRVAYGSVGLREMANNHPEMLKDITEDEAQQRAIIYAVLKHEQQHHDLGLDAATVEAGLELNNTRPGHEVEGHSL